MSKNHFTHSLSHINTNTYTNTNSIHINISTYQTKTDVIGKSYDRRKQKRDAIASFYISISDFVFLYLYIALHDDRTQLLYNNKKEVLKNAEKPTILTMRRDNKKK